MEQEHTPLHIVLNRPEIPNNTGNIGRLCVGTASVLHLVKPLGFQIDERAVRRAGLDYWKNVQLRVHENLEDALAKAPRAIYFSSHAKKAFTQCPFQEGDHLVFGSETTGLPKDLLAERAEHCYTIPMWGPIRSHNLANAVSIVLYEAYRQLGRFPSVSG